MDQYYKKRLVPLALPALILFLMVVVIPFIVGVIYSFTGWRGTYFAGGEHFWESFVGFDNYIKAFKEAIKCNHSYLTFTGNDSVQ